MKNTLLIVFLVLAVMLAAMSVSTGTAEEIRHPDSLNFVAEGKVTFAKARSLVLNGQQYPVSMYVRVFQSDEKGPETTMQIIANIGKIDKARVYIFGGKIVKIIILDNI